MYKIHQTLHRDSLKHKEQLSFLSPLQIPSEFKVINFGTNSKLNIPQILKGFKPFWKNSDKFLKILSSHDILEYNFTLTHFYSNIGCFFTSGKNDLVKLILKIAGHLGMLGPLTRIHH
jgi:hypothetical protein